MKKIAIGIIFLLTILFILWLDVKDIFNPVKRENIQHPIYTIGDLNYEQAISQGKQVVKFGPAFWGVYPGGIAFDEINVAEEFIKNNVDMLKKFSNGWAIYKLSGDFKFDTKCNGSSKCYINKSLFVIKIVKKSGSEGK